MRRYESLWVVNGDLPDEEVKSAIDKFSGIISSQGGTLVGLDEWGRRKLAYKIQGTIRGYYVLADFAGTSETVRELERNYRIDDRIIRYLTTKKSDKVNLEALQAEIAAKAKAAAAVRTAYYRDPFRPSSISSGATERRRAPSRSWLSMARAIKRSRSAV